MKSHYFIVALSLLVGFVVGVAFCHWGPTSSHRYQIAIAGQAGNAFQMDTQTGDTWLLTSSGQKMLTIPPSDPYTKEEITSLYTTLKDAKVVKDISLHGWAVQMNILSGTNGHSSGKYDAILLNSNK